MRDTTAYDEAERDPEGFWAKFAEELEWSRKWTTVLDWSNPPHAKWFVGGQINVSTNCVDRHVRTARRNKAAIIWEGEPGDRRTLTYFDLYRQVSAFANVLKSLGDQKGRSRRDLHAARARTGDRDARVRPHRRAAQHCLRRASAPNRCAIASTTRSARSVDHRGWRVPPRSVVPLQRVADEAIEGTPSIENVVMLRRDRCGRRLRPGLDRSKWHWWHELMANAPLECPAEPMDAEDLLYILYTSGTTGKPKGIMHTTGGYLTGTYATTKWVFDLKDDDVYWCTADIGWVTGHSYVVYGPLANGATVVMYEGAPDWPQKDRLWEIIERYGVTMFYTAPTAIRAFMKWGTDWPKRHNMSSLRLLGSVGEPINPEAWIWYHKNIGGERCPVVDTWWQTETGMIMITPLARCDAAQARVGNHALSRHQSRDSDAVGAADRSGRRPARADAPVAVDAAGHLRRSRALREAGTGASGSATFTSRATARSAMKTAISGCSVASTT